MPSPIDPRDDDSPDGASLVDLSKRFSAGCMAAIRAFRSQKPWRGTLEERQAKVITLHAALCDAYGIEPVPPLRFIAMGEIGPDQQGTAGLINQPDGTRTLGVAGRLSVTSYLWGFARLRGLDAEESFRWSLSLFARVFPRSFAACHFVGPILIRDNNQNL